MRKSALVQKAMVEHRDIKKKKPYRGENNWFENMMKMKRKKKGNFGAIKTV